MRTKEHLREEAMMLLEIISTYKVLNMEQLLAVMGEKDVRQKQTVLKILEKEDRIFINGEIVSSVQKWNKCYDKALIIAFWVLLDFWEEVLYNTPAPFPAKIEFITNDEAYDIIVAEKGQENILNAFFRRNYDNTIKHFVVVSSEEQMYNLKFAGIEAFCLVDDEGNISYYKEK